MVNKSVSLKEQLLLMKQATMLSGGIHEAQALQLRNYPLIIEGANKAITKIDTEKKIVYYDVTMAKFKNTKKFKKTCEAIATWVRSVIWDDTSIVFKINGEIKYDTRNQSPQ